MDGSPVAGKQGLVPTADAAPGTIYNPTTLTLALSQLTSDGAPGQFKFRVIAVGGPSNMPAEELTPVVTVGECCLLVRRLRPCSATCCTLHAGGDGSSCLFPCRFLPSLIRPSQVR